MTTATLHSPLIMLKKIAALLVSLLFFCNADAAHPLITDDTGTQGKGKFQIEINSAFSTDKINEGGISTKTSASEMAAALSFGMTDTIDLVLGIPWQSYTISQENMAKVNEHGFCDMSIEIKWRLFDPEENGLSLALKPGLSIPSGSEEKGLGNGAISEGLTAIATHKGKLGALHANLGYTHLEYRMEENINAARNNVWHASLAGELNLTEKLRSVANIGIETNKEKASDTNPAFLLGGLIYSAYENFDLDVGVKAGLNKSETDTVLLAGLAARF